MSVRRLQAVSPRVRETVASASIIRASSFQQGFALKLFVTALVSLVLLVSGCTSVSSLQKASRVSSFTLEANHTRTRQGGVSNTTWVEGLAKGQYKLIGEDSDYDYYVGEGDSVIVLSAERAAAYLQKGYITPFAERHLPQLTFAGGVGGLMLPKPGKSVEAKLFFEVRNANDGAELGPIGIAMVGLTERSFAYVPFGSESGFLKGLKFDPPLK